MEKKPIISLCNISKCFGTLKAVDALNLDLYEGEFFALLGPSGCGKTTLLRMIAGFESPDEGKMLLDGKDLVSIGVNRRPINMMFQSYALFPHLTIRANIAYGLEMERLDKSVINQRVDEILEKVQLLPMANRHPDQLSGGQRQRVALARAIVKRPRVLLLDEPLGALDKKLRETMQLELKKLQNEMKITFVMVTHDQEEALVMADRIALMKAGKIAQLDEPKLLYENPATSFVAQFIGVTNLIEGTAAQNGIQINPFGLIKGNGSVEPGVNCALSIRPERIKISHGKPLDQHNTFHGKVTEIAYHGQDIQLHVGVEQIDKPFIARIGVSEASEFPFYKGQEVFCNWLPKNGRILEH